MCQFKNYAVDLMYFIFFPFMDCYIKAGFLVSMAISKTG